MLKPQDIVVLLKLLADSKGLIKSQHQLATHVCLSVSAINASLARLGQSGLLHLDINDRRYLSVIQACEELLVFGVKYFIPAQLGEYTCGLAASYAAPIFEKKILSGDDPIPVWPYAQGDRRGIALEPLYHCVPVSLVQYPDQKFYDLLALVDAIRQGRAREKNIAVKLLRERLRSDK